MSKKFTIIIEKDKEGRFVAEVVELPGCHSQAKTMDELIERTKEAIELYLEEQPIGKYTTEFVGVQRIAV